MKLKKILRENASVTCEWSIINAAGHWIEKSEEAPEAPKPSLDAALLATTPICARIMDIDIEHMEVYGLAVSYSKHNGRSVKFHYRRELLGIHKSYVDKTPVFRMDEPFEGEDCLCDITDGECFQIQTVINEAELYINGERLQRLLPLDDDAEPTKGESTQTDLLSDETRPE